MVQFHVLELIFSWSRDPSHAIGIPAAQVRHNYLRPDWLDDVYITDPRAHGARGKFNSTSAHD